MPRKLLKHHHHNKHREVVRYPWDDWFAKSSVTLKKGIDFICAIHGMAAMIRNEASKRQVKVSLRIRDDKEITIVFGDK